MAACHLTQYKYDRPSISVRISCCCAPARIATPASSAAAQGNSAGPFSAGSRTPNQTTLPVWSSRKATEFRSKWFWSPRDGGAWPFVLHSATPRNFRSPTIVAERGTGAVPESACLQPGVLQSTLPASLLETPHHRLSRRSQQQASTNTSATRPHGAGVSRPRKHSPAVRVIARDTAWLLVQLLRHVGLAARFVSGYLIQLKPDVKSLDGPSGTVVDFTDLHVDRGISSPARAGWGSSDVRPARWRGPHSARSTPNRTPPRGDQIREVRRSHSNTDVRDPRVEPTGHQPCYRRGNGRRSVARPCGGCRSRAHGRASHRAANRPSSRSTILTAPNEYDIMPLGNSAPAVRRPVPPHA